MKHDLNDQVVRSTAIKQLAYMLKCWRLNMSQAKKNGSTYYDAIQTAECAILALGGDPDAPDTQPDPPKKRGAKNP